MSKPVVSVCMITYNHECYIEEAINGVLLQQTDFKVELVISNDFSTDATGVKIRGIIDQNPGLIIQYFEQTNNSGMIPNFIFTLKKCTGKYIALCEGDDHWTDPLKLQKQVDFLEKNASDGICAHKTLVKNEVLNRHYFIPEIEADLDYDFKDYIIRNNTATCSLVFERKYLENLPGWFLKSPFGDLALVLHVMNQSNGSIHVLKEVMGVYRVHTGGIHGQYYQNKQELIKSYKQHILFNRLAEREYGKDKILIQTFYQKYINTYSILSDLYKQENNRMSSLKYSLKFYYYNIVQKLNLLFYILIKF